MLSLFIVFLFILYCILESSKYQTLEYVEKSKDSKTGYKKTRKLNKKIVCLKLIVYLLLIVLVTVNHFIEPLSRSTGILGLLLTIAVLSIFLIMCIIDCVKLRRSKSNHEKED